MSKPFALLLVRQGVRLTLLPFPAAFVQSVAALQITDFLLRPDRSNLESGEPAEYIGGFLLVLFVVMLQVLVGVPSLLALDASNSGFRRYLATAGIVALILSLVLATILRAPQFGETLGWMFSRVLLFFGAPLVVGYSLAFYFRSRHDQSA